jgi:hypothetical protein
LGAVVFVFAVAADVDGPTRQSCESFLGRAAALIRDGRIRRPTYHI